MTMIDLTEHKIIFDSCKRLHPDSSWIEHIPFAFYLISSLKPHLFVELGVDRGTSFNAFCQAAKTLKTATECYGVDTWKGDEHAGYYDESTYQELFDYHQAEYGDCSHLLKMTFDEALEYFSDGSIDLLHIDGCHTYEAVKHDFESWLPKLSDRGVVVLHDTLVRERSFGVWKLWEAISHMYPSFEFKHEHGLGVIAVGKNVDHQFLHFLAEAKEDGFIQNLFFTLGRRIRLDQHSNNLEDALRREKGRIERKEAELHALRRDLQAGEERIRVRHEQMMQKDRELKDRDELLAGKDQELRTRDELLAGKDQELRTRDELLAGKDRELCTRDELLARKDQELRIKTEQIALSGVSSAERVALQQEISRLRAIEESVAWKTARKVLDFVDYTIVPFCSRRSRLLNPLAKGLATFAGRVRKKTSTTSASQSGASEAKTLERYEPKGKRKTSGLRKISFLTTPYDADGKRYRVYNVIEALTQRGVECFVFRETNIDSLDLLLDSDMLVIFRVAMTENVEKIIDRMRENNIPVIFDIDDLVFDPDCIRHITWLNHTSEEIRQNIINGIHKWKTTLLRSDYVTCSTDLLGSYAAKTGKRSFVFPNTINDKQYALAGRLIKKRKHFRADGKIKVGYFSGTYTHNRDFMEASDALYEILTKYPAVEFHLIGQLDLDERFSKFGERIVRQSRMPYPNYLEYKSLMDITIAPLEQNNPFTGSKSELKIFEAALLEIPTVASPTDSYKKCITDGVNGFLSGTKEEWYKNLSLLIEDHSLRERIGKAARKSFTERYYIKNVIDDVIRIYEEILDDYRLPQSAVRRKFTFPERLPTFSIVSVLYRKEKQLPYFMECLMNQTYPGTFEIIFVDDRSPDHCAKAVDDFIQKARKENAAKKVPDVHIIRNERNLGNCASRNIGIRRAQGDVIIVIDADCLVNADFLSAHAGAYAYDDCDVAIGPFNLETNGQPPFEVLESYEKHPERVSGDALLQDPINRRSFLNCVTRNFSIRKGVIEDDLFDVSFSYSADEHSGFGWEDVEMGYRLYKKGARIKFVPEAFSIHISHPSTVDESTKPLRSLRNFRRLYEKHPELFFVARRWTLDTYEKICRWVEGHNHPKNDDRLYLDNLFQRFLPAPFYIPTERKLRILTYRWHCAHQYELYKLPYEFTLVTGLGTGITGYWEYDKRPLPANARFRRIDEVNVDEYDLAVMHFDENILAPENTNGVIAPEWGWGEAAKWFRRNLKIPIVAVCHGTPQFYGQYNMHYAEPDLLQVMEKEREKIVDFMGDVLVVVNSHQAQREWGFRKSKVIWHGFDPTEFYPATYEKGILMMLEKALTNRPHYNGYFLHRAVFADFPEELAPEMLSVPDPDGRYRENSNPYAYAKFRNYLDAIRSYSIYFNPTLRSPMPRSRGEAMMCGLAVVSTNNHDVDLFIKNGVNGFYSNDPHELREYLLYLLKHPDACRSIGLEGRAIAVDLFNHDRYLHEWNKTIDELVG